MSREGRAFVPLPRLELRKAGDGVGERKRSSEAPDPCRLTMESVP